jgi:hypothetical protein
MLKFVAVTLLTYALAALLSSPPAVPVAPPAPAPIKAAPVTSPAAAPAVPPRQVAVLELASLGLPEQMRHNLETLLVNSVRTLPKIQLISRVDIQIALQSPKNKALVGCGGGPACNLQLGRALGADVVVFGTLAAMGDSFNLSLRALQVSDGHELGRQNINVAGSPDKLIPEVRLAAYRLLAPERIVGALMVDTDVPEVVITVGEVDLGTTPLKAPIQNLPVGPCRVRLHRLGYQPLEENLVIAPFETTRLRLQLRKSPG